MDLNLLTINYYNLLLKDFGAVNYFFYSSFWTVDILFLAILVMFLVFGRISDFNPVKKKVFPTICYVVLIVIHVYAGYLYLFKANMVLTDDKVMGYLDKAEVDTKSFIASPTQYDLNQFLQVNEQNVSDVSFNREQIIADYRRYLKLLEEKYLSETESGKVAVQNERNRVYQDTVNRTVFDVLKTPHINQER